MRHDIHEDWIEFFHKDSIYESYHEYILRRLKEDRENEASERQQRSLPSGDT
jgi:hypothetical protein